MHSFTSSNICLAERPRNQLHSTSPCNMLFGNVPIALTTCPNQVSFLFLLNDLQQCVILPNVLCNSPVYLRAGTMHGIIHLLQSSVAMFSMARMRFYRALAMVYNSQAYKKVEMTRERCRISFVFVFRFFRVTAQQEKYFSHTLKLYVSSY